jgi:cell division protein FtsN
VLRKKAKKLTPEQQLMGAVVSVLMKKAQVVMEVRAENNLLEERILDIIREEKGYSDQDLEEDIQADEEENIVEVHTETSQSAKAEKETLKKVKPEPAIQDIEAEEVDEDVSILEVAEEQETEA